MNRILRVGIDIAFYFLLFLLTEHTHRYIEANQPTSKEQFNQPYRELVTSNNIKLANQF